MAKLIFIIGLNLCILFAGNKYNPRSNKDHSCFFRQSGFAFNPNRVIESDKLQFKQYYFGKKIKSGKKDFQGFYVFYNNGLYFQSNTQEYNQSIKNTYWPWGLFTLVGDTIVILNRTPPNSITIKSFAIAQFKIINKTEIQPISGGIVLDESKSFKENMESLKEKNKKFIFKDDNKYHIQKFKETPSINSCKWLDISWFWATDSLYNDWKSNYILF